jgi:hypothetical protein
MRLMVLIAALAAMATPVTATAGDWRLLSVGKSGAIAVDMEGVRSSGSRRTGWTALIFPMEHEGMDYILVRYEWDCAAETSKRLTWVAYKEDGMNVGRNDTPESTVVVTPDSNEVHILNAVCRNVFQVPAEGWSSVRTLLVDYRTAPPT